MDYNHLLDMATELGYRLAVSGAETFRVEESINRVMTAYGLSSEVNALPTCVIVSIMSEDGKPLTRMRRIGQHGTDLDGVERYSNLSRLICENTPEPKDALRYFNDTENSRLHYPRVINLLGYVLTAAGFTLFFGGNLTECLISGVCGLLIGIFSGWMDDLGVNHFFRTIITAFLTAFAAYAMGAAFHAANADKPIIGAIMLLVPGLLFTNSIRDIIFGDTNSGIIRLAQVFMIAAAIAAGTGAAWYLSDSLWNLASYQASGSSNLITQCVGCLIGCTGFTIVFNIHGKGSILCVLGGVVTWGVYTLLHFAGCGDMTAYFGAAACGSLYAEIMARIRKLPAISYLVISSIPLLPGADIYYAANRVANGDLDGFISYGGHALIVASGIAVGILLISTAMRGASEWRRRKKEPRK